MMSSRAIEAFPDRSMPGAERVQQIRRLWPTTRLDRWMDDSSEPGMVSIIIPTYNRASLLSETLNSVVEQTYRPIEVIIVDDGSTDDTPELVRDWREKARSDLRVKFFRQENQGANFARNRGLVHSTGVYIQYLDSDDVLHPQQVELLVHALEGGENEEEPVCDLVYSHQKMSKEVPSAFTSQIEHSRLAISEWNRIGRNPMVVPKNRGSVLLRRQLCRQAGPWDESLIRWQDMEYMFRVSALRPSYRRVEEELYLMRKHEKGRIHDLYYQQRGIEGGLNALPRVEDIIEEAEQQHEQARYCVARYYLGLAKLAMKVGDKEQVWQALDGASRQAPNRRFQVQLRLVRLAYEGLGPWITHRALDGYTYLRALSAT